MRILMERMRRRGRCRQAGSRTLCLSRLPGLPGETRRTEVHRGRWVTVVRHGCHLPARAVLRTGGVCGCSAPQAQARCPPCRAPHTHPLTHSPTTSHIRRPLQTHHHIWESAPIHHCILLMKSAMLIRCTKEACWAIRSVERNRQAATSFPISRHLFQLATSPAKFQPRYGVPRQRILKPQECL